MLLTYNGVKFELLRISDFVQTLVTTEDETNYLYNSVDIRCQCILNAALNNLGSPAANAPSGALLALVKKLVEPRKKLLVQGDTEGGLFTVLESPFPGMDTDFRFGPKCTVLSIDPFHGNASIWVDLQFHTDLGCIDQDYLLSNRYTWTVSHDPDTFSAVHQIQGEAHFRMDLLRQKNVTPDELRAKFIMPPPAMNFHRNPPTVSLSAGGDAVEYQIVDVEQMLNGPGLQAFGATKIEVRIDRNYESGLETESGAWGAAKDALGWYVKKVVVPGLEAAKDAAVPWWGLFFK